MLGLSGGLDSVVLLHLILRLQKEMGFFVRALHVNYHLRGKESLRDEKFVRLLSQQWDFPLDVLSAKITRKSSLQDQAREIRYRFFDRMSRKYKFQKVLVAHHAQDQVETFFIKLVQGSGVQGLISMQVDSALKDSSLKVLRPLLSFTKKDLRDYAKLEKLKWCEDSSNQKSDYVRNFIRHKILKYLEKINPQFVKKVSESLEILKSENDFIDKQSQQFISSHLKRSRQVLKLALKPLLQQHIALRMRVYFLLLKEKGVLPSHQYLMDLDTMVMHQKKQMKITFSQGYGARLVDGVLQIEAWRQRNLKKRGFY